MIDIAYILDGNTRTWYEAIDSDHIELDLDYLSFSLDVLYEGYDNQGQMVKVEKNFYKPVSSIYNSKNQRRTKPLYSYININELSDDIELNDFYEAPIRWRVQQGNSGEDIHVSLEFVKIYRHFIFPEIQKGKSIFSVPQVGSVKHWYINIKNKTTYFYPDWSENFSRKNNIGFESRMFHSFWAGNLFKEHRFFLEQVEDCWLSKYILPEAAVSLVFNLMGNDIKEQYGFAPSCVSKMPVPTIFYSYIINPLDAHLPYISWLFDDIETCDGLLTSDCTDVFSAICQRLEISNPPKGLRRAYAYNPYAPTIYKLLWQLGFRDVNIIQRFYNETQIAGLDMMSFHYSTKYKRLEYSCLKWKTFHIVDLDEVFAHYVNIGLKKRGENAFSRQLLRIGKCKETADILRMFHQYTYDLSPEIHYRLFYKRFDIVLHDNMVDEINLLSSDELDDLIHKHYEYSEAEKDLECDVTIAYDDVYEIRLAKNKNELTRISRAMSNCVKSYAAKVSRGECIILTVKKNSKYKACIEIVDNRVIQCLGPHNKVLQGIVSNVVVFWAREKKLVYREKKGKYVASYKISPHITDNDDNDNKEWFHPTIEYMLTLPEAMVNEEYFKKMIKIILELEEYAAPEKDRQHEFNDELTYLLCTMPQGEVIFRHAFLGNIYAQIVLSLMYEKGHYISKNIHYARYWHYRSFNIPEEICQAFRNGRDYESLDAEEIGVMIAHMIMQISFVDDDIIRHSIESDGGLNHWR